MSPPSADSTKNDEQKCSQRKINKPLIEKRRRARINDCLSQLKTIVLEATDSKAPRPSKLEKADILEMTVDFVKSRLTRDQEKSVKNLPADDNLDYEAGYSNCLSEISKFLEQTKPEHLTLQQNIVDHVTETLRTRLTKDEGQGMALKKLPLPPLRKNQRNIKEQLDEAIDLRVNCDSTEKEAEPTIFNKRLNESTNQNLLSNKIVNQSSMPIGLLCGGQVMLLVQLPQTMTSQHENIQTLQYVNQPQNSTSPVDIKPISHILQPQLIQGRSNLNQSDAYASPLVPQPFPVASNPLEEERDKDSINKCIPNHESSDHQTHWRPW